jgi:hypothetical protein
MLIILLICIVLYIPVSSYFSVIFILVLSKPQHFCKYTTIQIGQNFGKYTQQFKLEAAIISFELRDQYACGCLVVVFRDMLFKLLLLSTTATSVTFAIENCTSTQKHILKTHTYRTKQQNKRSQIIACLIFILSGN